MFNIKMAENGKNRDQALIDKTIRLVNKIEKEKREQKAEQKEAEQKEALKGYASKALHQIQTLAETAVSENVKLNANRDLLDRAGWKPIDRSEHITK
mgnify:CR=1 FL=1